MREEDYQTTKFGRIPTLLTSTAELDRKPSGKYSIENCDFFVESRRKILEKTLARLPENERTVLKSIFYEGMTYDALTLKMNIPLEEIRKIEEQELTSSHRIATELGLLNLC